ncbi:peptidyl-prolyl cis-trans isomerase 1-like protein [Corchorus olitorius]|uniref:Peptidyl-prolyl cis-trans isomerase 1-like protein n=1 Tax=Corchorus olitorius TaxID=93759 RepID=A0A1R3L458_9ROSI|nr:peptidyl-prolyl cis-trans isomerase 1-like protein [Corchorus olitorius]OMP14080.1 peptidyl-prolyl cis-trans isomerase 1-like protein [Corchorus olitorius]
MTIGGQSSGRIVMELFPAVTPRTAEHREHPWSRHREVTSPPETVPEVNPSTDPSWLTRTSSRSTPDPTEADSKIYQSPKLSP